ncbi:50S ribosomal protein L18e [Candidatus Woesearchaeota archaeon]|nr:50S ribosomal protein L18e [Candidatus Woesearchaeota archaeon]
MAKRTGPTNPLLKGLVQELRKKANEHGCNIWKRVADDLEKSSRKRRIINLYKINKATKENETVIVPGKVLSVGDIDHNITVAAFNFSDSALEKINKKGKAISITELIKKDPKGKKIRILG